MKFIHLSDLHIGKRVNEFSMLEEQRYILLKILEIIGQEKPDAVLIAGDVYDKSQPSGEAVKMLDEFIFRLSDMPPFRLYYQWQSRQRRATCIRLKNYGKGKYFYLSRL